MVRRQWGPVVRPRVSRRKAVGASGASGDAVRRGSWGTSKVVRGTRRWARMTGVRRAKGRSTGSDAVERTFWVLVFVFY